MSGFDVPIVLMVFNRPQQTARAFDVVRAVQPATLLLVADGPRVDHPDDVARCEAVRAIVDDVDWPCTVVRDFSDDNLGCDRRIVTGLDRVFSVVDRAIVLEDDIVAHPSFFPWCAAMLDRYADAPDVLHVSGRNDLGRYGPPGAEHLLVRRGSGNGWATWAEAWQAVDPTLGTAPHDLDATIDRVDELALDPLVRSHLLRLVDAAASGALGAWDCTWWASCVLVDGWAVVPPVNLVHNCGYGPDANRTTNADDFRAFLPVGVVPAPADTEPSPRPAPDPSYDRSSLLVDLMATYTRPETVARLARSRHVLARVDGPIDADLLHHLAPFDHVDESLAALAHLRAAGLDHPQLDALEAALRASVAQKAGA